MKLTVEVDEAQYAAIADGAWPLDLPLDGAEVEVRQRDSVFVQTRRLMNVEAVTSRYVAVTTGGESSSPAIRAWLAPVPKEEV